MDNIIRKNGKFSTWEIRSALSQVCKKSLDTKQKQICDRRKFERI